MGEKIIHRFLKYLENKSIAPTRFEKDAGISNGYLLTQKKRNADLGEGIIFKLIENSLDLNPIWLVFGTGHMLKNVDVNVDVADGEMLKNTGINTGINTGKTAKTEGENYVISETTGEEIAAEPDIIYFRGKALEKKQLTPIPLYNLRATAGLVALYKDSHTYEPMDYLSVPNLGKCDGAVFASGDSMYPLVKAGDIVVYKFINDSNTIFWGEMYLISYDYESEEYVAIKYLQKSEIEGYIKLVSQNQHHQPVDIPLNSIRALALIKATIRYNAMR